MTNQTVPQSIAAVLQELTEQTSLRMFNMRLAPEITAAQIQELEKQALAQIEALMLGCLPEKMDEGLAARHLAEEFIKAAKHGKRDIDKLQPYQDADRSASKTVGFNEAIDQTREAIKGVLHE